MKTLRLAIVLLAMACASAALAQDYARSGMYGQVNGVASFDHFEGAPGGLFDTGIGVSGRLGYRMSPNIAIEGMLDYSGDFADFGGVDLTSTLLMANGRYYFLTDRVQPYLSAGLGWGFVNTNVAPDDSGFAMRFGGGADFYLSDNFGLTAEVAYNVGTGDIDDFDYTTLGWGVFFRF